MVSRCEAIWQRCNYRVRGTQKNTSWQTENPTNFRWELENEAEKDKWMSEGEWYMPSHSFLCVLPCQGRSATLALDSTCCYWTHWAQLAPQCVSECLCKCVCRKEGTPFVPLSCFFSLPCKFPSLCIAEVCHLVDNYIPLQLYTSFTSVDAHPYISHYRKSEAPSGPWGALLHCQ